jgi:hypothetical protein
MLLGKSNTSKVIVLPNGTIRKTIDFTKPTAIKLNNILKSIYDKLHEYLEGVPPLIYHETRVLNHLSKYDIAPKVISLNPDSITMTNVGALVTKTTKFEDLPNRVNYIIKSLKEAGVNHNDLRNSFQNYTCLNGKLYLIDFQIADIKDTIVSKVMKSKLKSRSWDDIKDLNWLVKQFEEIL